MNVTKNRLIEIENKVVIIRKGDGGIIRMGIKRHKLMCVCVCI